MTIALACPRCGPRPRVALGAASYRCVNQVVVGEIPPPPLGLGLDRIPLFGAGFSMHRDVVVERHGDRRVWAPDRFVTFGEWVTIEDRSWTVIGNADDPAGAPMPFYDDCGAEYVDEHEAFLLLG